MLNCTLELAFELMNKYDRLQDDLINAPDSGDKEENLERKRLRYQNRLLAREIDNTLCDPASALISCIEEFGVPLLVTYNNLFSQKLRGSECNRGRLYYPRFMEEHPGGRIVDCYISENPGKEVGDCHQTQFKENVISWIERNVR